MKVSSAGKDSICIIDGCEKHILARGWCGSHYGRWKRWGDPLTKLLRYNTPDERFKAYTEWRGECLVWTGSLNSGYGQMRVGEGPMLAHRYAYVRAHGEIAEGLEIDHICRVRACVNIQHLRAVTRQQNMENMSPLSSTNSSGYRNVCWVRQGRVWRVQMRTKGVPIKPLCFPPYELHVAAYKARELRLQNKTFNDHDRK